MLGLMKSGVIRSIRSWKMEGQKVFSSSKLFSPSSRLISNRSGLSFQRNCQFLLSQKPTSFSLTSSFWEDKSFGSRMGGFQQQVRHFSNKDQKAKELYDKFIEAVEKKEKRSTVNLKKKTQRKVAKKTLSDEDKETDSQKLVRAFNFKDDGENVGEKVEDEVTGDKEVEEEEESEETKRIRGWHGSNIPEGEEYAEDEDPNVEEYNLENDTVSLDKIPWIKITTKKEKIKSVDVPRDAAVSGYQARAKQFFNVLDMMVNIFGLKEKLSGLPPHEKANSPLFTEKWRHLEGEQRKRVDTLLDRFETATGILVNKPLPIRPPYPEAPKIKPFPSLPTDFTPDVNLNETQDVEVARIRVDGSPYGLTVGEFYVGPEGKTIIEFGDSLPGPDRGLEELIYEIPLSHRKADAIIAREAALRGETVEDSMVSTEEDQLPEEVQEDFYDPDLQDLEQNAEEGEDNKVIGPEGEEIEDQGEDIDDAQIPRSPMASANQSADDPDNEENQLMESQPFDPDLDREYKESEEADLPGEPDTYDLLNEDLYENEGLDLTSPLDRMVMEQQGRSIPSTSETVWPSDTTTSFEHHQDAGYHDDPNYVVLRELVEGAEEAPDERSASLQIDKFQEDHLEPLNNNPEESILSEHDVFPKHILETPGGIYGLADPYESELEEYPVDEPVESPSSDPLDSMSKQLDQDIYQDVEDYIPNNRITESHLENINLQYFDHFESTHKRDEEDDFVDATEEMSQTNLIYPFERLINMGRHSTVTRQGRVESYSAFVMLGDCNGTAGIGYGKAGKPELALRNARLEAERSMITIPRFEGRTLHGPISYKHVSHKVRLEPLRKGMGLRAHGYGLDLANAFGLTDLRILIRGPRNTRNLLQCLFSALTETHLTHKELAILTGKKLVDQNLRWKPPTNRPDIILRANAEGSNPNKIDWKKL